MLTAGNLSSFWLLLLGGLVLTDTRLPLTVMTAVEGDTRIPSVKPTHKWCSVDEEFVPDSPLEGDGFEIPVPREIGSVSRFGRR